MTNSFVCLAASVEAYSNEGWKRRSQQYRRGCKVQKRPKSCPEPGWGGRWDPHTRWSVIVTRRLLVGEPLENGGVRNGKSSGKETGVGAPDGGEVDTHLPELVAA